MAHRHSTFHHDIINHLHSTGPEFHLLLQNKQCLRLCVMPLPQQKRVQQDLPIGIHRSVTQERTLIRNCKCKLGSTIPSPSLLAIEYGQGLSPRVVARFTNLKPLLTGPWCYATYRRTEVTGAALATSGAAASSSRTAPHEVIGRRTYTTAALFSSTAMILETSRAGLGPSKMKEKSKKTTTRTRTRTRKKSQALLSSTLYISDSNGTRRRVRENSRVHGPPRRACDIPALQQIKHAESLVPSSRTDTPGERSG